MEPLRGALLGYGFIGASGHVPAYLKRRQIEADVEIVAIADICEGRRNLVHSALPNARVYRDISELLKSEKALDFIDIATPPCDHATIAHAALDQGLHVLCEKPLTTCSQNAIDLYRHAKRAKRTLFPCHNYKMAPVIKAISETIESGKIGKVRSVTLNTFRNTHAKGVAEFNPHWRRERAISGGGIAMDHASHSFYLLFDWLKSYPTAITAQRTTLDSQYDTEDNFAAVLTFPTGTALVQLSWTAGVRKVIYSIQGERGAVTVNDDALEIALQEKTKGPDVAQGAVQWNVMNHQIASHWMDASHAGWFNPTFDRFKTAIHEQNYTPQDLYEACLCIQLIEAAYESASQSSREIQIPELHLL